jgi:organic radical activating enzyme
VSSCCRAHPIDIENQSIDYYLDLWQQESKLLDQGIELPGCEHCWQAEHSGQVSYRQSMSTHNKNYVEIFASNLCNQMCSYCSPKYSSTWEDNIQQAGNFVNISQSAKHNLVPPTQPSGNQELWIEKIKKSLCQEPVHLKLLGGEPLMQKRNLQKLLELNHDNVLSLNINTNLNPPDNKFLKWVLETFPKEKLSFDISLDTVPAHNAIPRAGFDQHKFLENLRLLEQHNVSFMFLSVVSVLNIFNITEYQTWLRHHQYRAKFFRINNPDCLDPCYLPDEFKQPLMVDAMPDTARQALEHCPKMVDLKQFEQYNYLSQYFQRTGTKITDHRLAAYWDWLQQKFKK